MLLVQIQVVVVATAQLMPLKANNAMGVAQRVQIKTVSPQVVAIFLVRKNHQAMSVAMIPDSVILKKLVEQASLVTALVQQMSLNKTPLTATTAMPALTRINVVE